MSLKPFLVVSSHLFLRAWFCSLIIRTLCIPCFYSLHFSFYLVPPLEDPHNLNVDVLALLPNSKCFHVLVVVNPFFLT